MIKRIAVADIKFDKRRACLTWYEHAEEVAALAASIIQVGQINPIMVDQDNNLVEGMLRLLALKSLDRKHTIVVQGR